MTEGVDSDILCNVLLRQGDIAHIVAWLDGGSDPSLGQLAFWVSYSTNDSKPQHPRVEALH